MKERGKEVQEKQEQMKRSRYNLKGWGKKKSW